MNRKIITTPKGYSILKEKIVRLKKEQEETAVRLSLAGGDIKENAEFTILEAKNLELLGEIEKLKNRLEKAEVCKKVNDKSLARLGNLVTCLWLNKQKKLTIELTDDITADPPHKIPVDSPFGEILLGKKVGDIVRRGKNEYQILEIE
jgi:transcription elongation GreA/GreB family factor